VPLLILVLLLAAGAAVLGWWIARSVREKRPGYPLQYAPPEGIGPAQAYYVMHETASKKGYIASLMYAAEKGVLTLEVGKDKSWTITDTGHGSSDLDPITATACTIVPTGGSFTAKHKDVATGEKLQRSMASFDTTVARWALDSKLLAKDRSKGGVWVVAAFVVLAINVFWNPFRMSVLDLIPGLLVVFGIGVFAPGSATRRTPEGREMWSRVGGFERILSTPSSEQRFDFASKKDLYTAYLPWAVVFGCADKWAEKYRVEMGTEPPTPSFFTGYALGSMASVGSLTDSFSSSLSSAVSAYNASQHSSSSGGGFSGGSFGGGGGGSW